MRFPILLRASLCAVLGLVSLMAAPAVATDEGLAAAEMVSEVSYRYFLGDSVFNEGILFTHAGDDRDIGGPDHDPARANIVAEFESYGLTVTLEPFTYSSTTYYNVVATKLGTVYPDQEYIIGAHFDSTCWSGPAPGADDNASGVSTVLEAARIISQFDSDYTIRFIAFDREEQGLYGSNAYVDDHYTDDILGMLSCDMMAWDPGTNTASLWGRDNPALPLKNAMIAAIAEYSEYDGASLTGIDRGWNGQSDHAPFDAAGFQAALFIEGEGFNNNTIHTSNDNVDNPGYINYPFAVRMTRSIVGWLVDAAGVQVSIDALKFEYPDGRPDYIDPAGGDTMRVVVIGAGSEVPEPNTGMLHYNTGGGWESVPMNAVGPNTYDAVFPAGVCGHDVQYYVSAEAVGGTLYTHPRTAPASTFSATFGLGMESFFVQNFDSSVSPGWTVEAEWEYGAATAGGGEYGEPDPGYAHTGTYIYGYNIGGDYANGLSEKHLTTTAIDCTGRYDVHLKFWRWLGVEQPLYDHAYVRVSNNGSTWTTVWQNSATIEDDAWSEMDYDISSVADDEATVYVRWTMGTTDSGWRYCGWNIDDVSLTSLACSPPCPGADGDMNGDGLVDGLDVQLFVEALALRLPTADETCHGDFASPAGLDVLDIQPMVDALLGD